MVCSCFRVHKFEIYCKNHTELEVSERSEEYKLGTSSGRIWRTFLRYVWLTVQIESVSSLVSTESLAFIMDWDEAGFSIQMYHNGEIRGNYYVNGSVDWFDYCDKDRMSMTEIDVMVNELGHEGLINYWYSIPGDSFDGGLVKLSEDTDVLDMLVFVPDTRVINIFLEHVLACNQEHFYSQVGSNIFINLDDDFGTNTGVVLQELDDNYGAIVPVGGGVGKVQKVKKASVVIEELNEEAGGEGKELHQMYWLLGHISNTNNTQTTFSLCLAFATDFSSLFRDFRSPRITVFDRSHMAGSNHAQN
ncbi:unnamed protein product [Prunus brigantina]